MINIDKKRTLVVLIALTLILVTHLPLVEANLLQSKTAEDVFSYIETLYISIEAKEVLEKSLRDGFSRGRLTPNRGFNFLERIHESGAQIPERERVFLIVARTLLDDLPINRMLNKIAEGLVRGKPLSDIAIILKDWKATLQQVRVLLESKNIKVGTKVLAQNKPLALNLFDPLIEEVADELEQNVMEKKDPITQQFIKRKVIVRLRKNPRIPPALVELIQNRVSGEELLKIAVSIKVRKSKKPEA